jgi:hypothetical protein
LKVFYVQTPAKTSRGAFLDQHVSIALLEANVNSKSPFFGLKMPFLPQKNRPRRAVRKKLFLVPEQIFHHAVAADGAQFCIADFPANGRALF